MDIRVEEQHCISDKKRKICPTFGPFYSFRLFDALDESLQHGRTGLEYLCRFVNGSS